MTFQMWWRVFLTLVPARQHAILESAYRALYFHGKGVIDDNCLISSLHWGGFDSGMVGWFTLGNSSNLGIPLYTLSHAWSSSSKASNFMDKVTWEDEIGQERICPRPQAKKLFLFPHPHPPTHSKIISFWLLVNITECYVMQYSV